MIFNIAIIINY